MCGECKVLVDNMASTYGGLCDNYCQALGLSCIGAWEEDQDTCQILSEQQCSVSMGTTSDAICECSPENPGESGGPLAFRPPLWEYTDISELHRTDHYPVAIAGGETVMLLTLSLHRYPNTY